MKRNHALCFFSFCMGFSIADANAHTVSVGYEPAGPGSVNFWYGTYHNPVNYTEGSIRLVGNGLDITSSFTLLTNTKPTGLVDGTTNFYSDGTQLVSNYGGTVANWQGALFTALTAGTYTFTYIPIASPTSVWEPTDSIILSSTVVLSSAVVGGSDIDNSQGSFPLSNLGGSVNPAFTGGTLQVDAPTSVAQDFTIDSAGGTIDQFGNTATFSGAISDATPGTPGSLTIANTGANSGAVVLSGVNTYTGATTIDGGGTLALSGGGSIATSSGVVDNGTLDISGTSAGASITTISGNGTVQLGAQNLTLTAASGSFAGSIGGSGGVIVTGGTATLAGSSNYTGGTTASNATLKVGADDNLGAPSGALTLNGGTLESTASFAMTRNIILTGNSAIATDTDTTLTLSGAMQGSNSSCFIKSGAGSLNMAGNATMPLGVCVQNGLLGANANIDGFVIVDTIGTLRGSGNVNGAITVSGRLAPGNSPGTLTTNGTVTMNPGSTLQIDINGTGTGSGPGNYSRLIITGAGNQFIAGGATLAPNLTAITGTDTYTPYVPQVGDRFRIVSAEGGIVGQFAPLTQPDGLAAETRMAVFYDAGGHDIDIRVMPTSYRSYIRVNRGTSNELAAGGLLDVATAASDNGTASAAQSDLLARVTALSGGRLNNAAKGLAGEIHAAMASTAPRSGQYLQTLVAAQLNTSTLEQAAAIEPKSLLWIDIANNRSHASGDERASSFNGERTQLTMGLDLWRDKSNRFGIGVSRSETQVDASLDSSGAIRETTAFGYGQHALASFIVDGIIGYGSNQWNTDRNDPLQSAALKTNNTGHNRLLGVGLRRPLHLRMATIEPFVRALWQHSARAAVNEDSDSSSALALHRYSETGTRLMAGVQGGSDNRDPLDAPLTYQYSVALGTDTGKLMRADVHSTLADGDLTTVAPQQDRGFAQANLTGTVALGHNAYAYLGVNGEARSGRSDVGANVGVKIAF